MGPGVGGVTKHVCSGEIRNPMRVARGPTCTTSRHGHAGHSKVASSDQRVRATPLSWATGRRLSSLSLVCNRLLQTTGVVRQRRLRSLLQPLPALGCKLSACLLAKYLEIVDVAAAHDARACRGQQKEELTSGSQQPPTAAGACSCMRSCSVKRAAAGALRADSQLRAYGLTPSGCLCHNEAHWHLPRGRMRAQSGADPAAPGPFYISSG